jgi:transposase
MSSPTILPDPACLQLLSLSADARGIVLTTRTCATYARCPLCDRPSCRAHSRYTRQVLDLPWCGLSVRLQLHTRRFFCDHPACERQIFTERLPGVVERYARRTERLNDWVTHVAFALGGEAGARLLGKLGVPLSGESVLNHIRALPVAAQPTPRVLSVDDFALRRGRTYGTIFVDLERHQVVDLLPERTASTVAAWLQAHPGVELITRDRDGEYRQGASTGAPTAQQVADRFHLLRNLRDVVHRTLRRYARHLAQLPAPGCTQPELTRRRRDRAASRERTRATMQARFERIHALATQGMSKSAIARALGIHRHTVQKYLALDTPPERRHASRRSSILTPYVGELLERWHHGCRNARQLWREIAAHGYPGSYRHVARLTGELRRQERLGHPLPHAPPGLSPTQAVGMLVRRPAERTEAEQHTLDRVRAVHPEVRQAMEQFESFAHLLRERADEDARHRLDQWLEETAETRVPELTAFVTKLRQDIDAVAAALVLPYSQGQTEGQINRLKLLKRAMYGRAKFDLLRQRVLYAAAS